MSMLKPLDVDQVKRNEKAAKEKRAKYTVGIVAPNGAMHEVFCPPPDDGSDEGPKTGDSLCRWVNGEPQVQKRYKNAGYILYADLAAQDGEPEKAERWQQAIGQRILGTPLRGDISGLYSKSVLERRAHSEAGSGKSGGKAFNVDTGELIDDPEAKKKRLAGLLAEAGVGAPPGYGQDAIEARAQEAAAKAEAEAEAKLKAKMKALEKDAKKKLDARMKELEEEAKAKAKADESKAETSKAPAKAGGKAGS